jgi:ribosome-binding protein aMBF1 (putative translation factor)
MPKTRDATKILDKIQGNDPELAEIVAQQRVNNRIAQMVYEARTLAGLSQAQLAGKVGTSQSAISRLEDADYEGGHALKLLQRIGGVLGRKFDIGWVEESKEGVAFAKQ